MKPILGIVIILGLGYLLFTGVLDGLGGTGSIGGGLSPTTTYSDKEVGISEDDVSYTPYEKSAKEYEATSVKQPTATDFMTQTRERFSKGFRQTDVGLYRKGTPPEGMTGSEWYWKGLESSVVEGVGGGAGSNAGTSKGATGRPKSGTSTWSWTGSKYE